MITSPTAHKLQPSDNGHHGHRLVVLVPDQDVDEILFSKAIRSVAAPIATNVLLVTIVKTIERELATYRRLISIASLVRNYDCDVEISILWNKSWIEVTRQVAVAGDHIACPPEMTVRIGMRKRQQLDTAIAQRLGLPIIPLPGFFSSDRSGISRVLRQICYWVGVMAILAVFSLLESDASQTGQGWIGQVIVILLMICEAGAILLWSSIMG